MTQHKLRLVNHSAQGFGSRIYVDDKQVFPVTFDLRVRPNEIPLVTLGVEIIPGGVEGHGTEIELDYAEVIIPSEQHDILVALGWTPPEDAGPQ